jgi:hypothetical protein
VSLADKLGPPDAREVSSAFPAFSFRPDSPSAPQGAGEGVGSPDEFRPKSGRNRGTGSATEPNFAVRMEKTSFRGLLGETNGDAPSPTVCQLVKVTYPQILPFWCLLSLHDLLTSINLSLLSTCLVFE